MATLVVAGDANRSTYPGILPSPPYGAVVDTARLDRGSGTEGDPGRPEERRGSASDDAELAELDQIARALQLRICYVCRRIFVLTPLLLVFTVSVVSAVLNWQRHENAKNEVNWSFASCLVVETRSAPDPKSEAIVNPADNAWRPEVVVRDYTTEIDSNKEVIAFFDANGLYRLPQARADALLSGIITSALLYSILTLD